MARLNEPLQPSVESIDALKRRFVRQNREIARANSTQSLRIRNLESEVTRLLSENVSLREQIIKLHYEAEKTTGRAVLEGVKVVKGKLEAKLAELGGLVQELGIVQNSIDSQSAQKRSINRSSPKISPDQRNWKNALTLSEVTGGADGRLPPIVEDKYFPRRTMDAEELLGIFPNTANTTDSPDLGPPPVAHFEEGDPIKFDPTQEQSPREGSAGNTEEAQPELSANLETRKKRRESSHRRHVDVKNASLESTKSTAAMATDVQMSQSLKSGAKRKLNVRDDNDQPGVVDEQSKQEFQFNRRSSDHRVSENGNTNPILNKVIKAACDEAPQAVISSISGREGKDGKERASEASATVIGTRRKALGPKSVNTDPVNSPVKVSRTSKDKVTEAKEDLAKIARGRNRPRDIIRPKNPGIARGIAKDKEMPIKDTEVRKPLEAPPETPAPPPSDLLSPRSSEPSAARPDSRDTPPPPDLGPDTGTGSFGRASRRPRGSVNYVQPNLRDKMRRPTKELVDAVGAEERARIAKAEDDASNSVFIKQEEDADAIPHWKIYAPKTDERARPEPTSPLSNKVGAADLPASITTERRRRTVVPALDDNAIDPVKPTSGAASAIAALTAGAQRSKRREEEDPSGSEKREQTREPTERTSIYDFTGSPPVDPIGKNASDTDQETVAKTVRSSRRHSSVPASAVPGTGSIMISRRGDRRRETLVARESGETAEKAEGQISRTKSVLEPGAGSEEAAVGRGERAASRRKSMMI
ncbi:MAG: hypothetical protein ALECFALPRED_006429 [Alectoria fallacina]|uniref:Shugoshin n=1 Tax=Alectoria fallacina TaxID=1903189 RepID=A0A8H3EP69_9LECA|nr:MAG: hypothetical protein ALECFALPRED_006429 [Alectoria fallacina]